MQELLQVGSVEEFWDRLLGKFLGFDFWTHGFFVRRADFEQKDTKNLVLSAWSQSPSIGVQNVSIHHSYPKNFWVSLTRQVEGYTHPRFGIALPAALRNLAMSILSNETEKEDSKPSWLVVPFRYQRTLIGVLVLGKKYKGPIPAETVRQIILMSDRWQSSYEKVIEISSLEKIARQDDLTSVMGRRAFHLVAQQWFADLRPFLLIILDIDNFKTYNDSFGHAMGDTIILEVVSAMSSALAPVNHAVGRFGGDEFMAIIECVDTSTGCSSADSIRTHLQSSLAKNDLPEVTLSIGAAHSREGYTSLSAIFSSADARLLSAKRKGRNRIVTDNEGCEDLEYTVRQFGEI
ncbi:MAG: GGDEF domain-containing protein [Spirochaetales bacterium]|nr:GGDEF domain-containing protein [Spirochaetales bacterium]